MTQDAVAPQGEATPSTNTNEAPAQAPEQAPEAPQTPDLGLTPEQAEKFSKFISSNGGFDSAFAKLKADVTGRKQDAPAEPAKAPVVENTTPEPAPAQPQTQTQPTKIPDGFISQQEINTRRYNRDLAEMPQYAGIKEDILNGNYLKEMTGMGMVPMDTAGNLNEKVILQYLDLKAKTVPAPAPSTPLTNTPLKQYTDVEGDITDFGQALSIVKEGVGHPRYEEAKKIVGSKFDLPQPEQK